MLKEASFAWIVAVGIFLIVAAATGTGVSVINSTNEPIEADFTEEVENSIKVTNENGEENSNTSCGAPPEIEGTITPELEGAEHRVGTNISYQCDFGYVSRGSGSFLLTCEFDEQTRTAKWTKPDVLCVSRSCGDPGYVANARRIGNLFTFPNRVEFNCEDGYKLRGLKARYCQANGDWSGRLPSCEKVYCRVPPDPLNGRAFYSSLEYGTELRYECSKGFALSHEQTRVCNNDGIWSNNAPECIETRCKIPESPARGSVQLLGEPRVGSLALYFCDEDTTLVGSSSSKCLSSGDWTFDPPKCMRSCKITEVRDGEIGRYERVRISKYSSRTTLEFSKFHAGESVKHNEAATLKCNQGFTPVNSSLGSRESSAEVMCNDGLWIKPMLCEASPCLGNPPPIENGSPVIVDNSHGKVIWYRCHPDFSKVKLGKVECDHGTWRGNTPVCADTRCPMAGLDFPGLLKPESEFLKSRSYFSITCARGYRKRGSKEKIRCFNGEWDINKNPCEIEICDDEPPTVINGRPLQFTREHGSLVHYECDEHFDLVGTSTVQCDVGKWEGRPPICQENTTSVTTSTMRYASRGLTPESLNNFPSSNPADLCSCVFDFDPQLVLVTVNGRRLHPAEIVTKGEIVMFSCVHPGMNLRWPNGLVIFGSANLICNKCKTWLQSELPTCINQELVFSALLYNDKMRILPSGAVEIIRNESIEISCMNRWLQPKWYPSDTRGMSFSNDPENMRMRTQYFGANMYIGAARDEHIGRFECFSVDGESRAYPPTVLELRLAEPEKQCPVLSENTRRGQFFITYENDRKVNSGAYYSCRDSSQKLIGEDTRRCLESGRWSGTFPSCEDITCWKHSTYNGLEVSYTNSNKMNSIAKFHCANQRTLVGINSTVCQKDGNWRDPWPRCGMVDIRCPLLDKKGIFTIHYSNQRRINSTAQFYCIDRYKRVDGCSVMTCQQNGEWSGTYPSCIDYVNCTRFQDILSLEISYSDGVRVESVASFHCKPPSTLVGSSSATCYFNGTWSHPPPFCEAPKCSIDDLFSSLPEGIVADLSEMADAYVEFVPYGTDVRLLCEDGLIRIGNSKAICESQKKWEHGNIQCVPGCRLNSDDETHLLIEPMKEYYRFGDFIILSCPPGQKLTTDVERVMCLGKSWSDDLPGCTEITQTSPSTLRETRKSA